VAVDVPVGRDGSWEKVTLFHVEEAERVPVTETVKEVLVDRETDTVTDALPATEGVLGLEAEKLGEGVEEMEAIEILGMGLAVDVCDCAIERD